MEEDCSEQPRRDLGVVGLHARASIVGDPRTMGRGCRPARCGLSASPSRSAGAMIREVRGGSADRDASLRTTGQSVESRERFEVARCKSDGQKSWNEMIGDGWIPGAEFPRFDDPIVHVSPMSVLRRQNLPLASPLRGAPQRHRANHGGDDGARGLVGSAPPHHIGATWYPAGGEDALKLRSATGERDGLGFAERDAARCAVRARDQAPYT